MKKRLENNEKETIEQAFSVIEQNLFVFLPSKAKNNATELNEITDYEYYTNRYKKSTNHQCTDVSRYYRRSTLRNRSC